MLFKNSQLSLKLMSTKSKFNKLNLIFKISKIKGKKMLVLIKLMVRQV